MPDSNDRRHRTGDFWLDMVVALAAVCISIASLWVALRADRTQERLLAASVWPVLLFETSDYAPTGEPGQIKNIVRFTLTNAGVGPARIRWFDVYYRGKSVAGASTLLAQCCRYRRNVLASTLISNYMQERVLAAREAVNFIEFPRNTRNAAQYGILDRERLKVNIRVCYCSVLDDCWVLDSRRHQPDPVRECPRADTPLFQS